MKIAVVGCGGIGGVVAGVLARREHDVTCVEANEELARTLGERGITVERRGRVSAHPVRAVSIQKIRKERFDLIVVSVKSFDMRNAIRETAPALAPGGFFLTIQNGLEILAIVKDDPSLRVVAGAISFNSNMLDVGRFRVTSEGGISVGPLHASGITGNKTPWWAGKVDVLRELFEPEIPIEAASSIEGVLWGKLLITCGVTGLTGVAGLVLGELMRLRAARKLFYRIAEEGVAVADKAGVKIEKLPGAINPARFSSGKGGYPVFIRYLLLKLVGLKYRDLRGGIYLDIKRARSTEIDYINGALVKQGEIHGVPTRVNGEVVRVVKEIEAGRRSMDVENLNEILSRDGVGK
jgi:2-dehydropantoate 2-reductase